MIDVLQYLNIWNQGVAKLLIISKLIHFYKR